MVELNHRDRTIKVKLVYYGPPLGGKTTNLQLLHRAADPARRGEMISVNSAQDRTILFDLLPLKTPGFRGFDLALQVLAVPGQAVYAATRRLVLKGADALVFVANSALDRWEENVQSLREMTQNLLSHHLEPSSLPLVFQYNKRDLPQVVGVEALDRALNSRGTEAIPAVAVHGEGVLETFTAILARTVEELAGRYATLNVTDGSPVGEWAEQMVLRLFGTNSLKREPAVAKAPALPPEAAATPADEAASGRPGASAPVVGTPAAGKEEPPAVSPATVDRAADTIVVARRPRRSPSAKEARTAEPPGHTVVRAILPEREVQRPAVGPDERAGELVDSYAQASAQLATALAEMRAERDAARQRLQDLRRTMQAAQEILAGCPFEATLGPVLACMSRAGGSEHASFWLPQRGRPPSAVALVGLASDPILANPGALRHLSETVSRGQAPVFALAADDVELGRALDTSEGRFAAVLAVPCRTPGGLQGIAVFYYAVDAARPAPGALDHLAELARTLSAALELAARLQAVKAAERALELALAGAAAPDRQLDLSRGEIRRESVYLEDLLAELRTPEVAVELDPAAELVTADAALLRVALRLIVDEARARAGDSTVPLTIRAGVWSDGVRVRVRPVVEGGGPSGRRESGEGPGLALARRIAELHGGSLEDRRQPGAVEIVLILPAP